MKRLTTRQKERHRRRARRREARRRHLRKLAALSRRQGRLYETVSSLGPDGVRMVPMLGTKRPAPRVLSLQDNFEETAAFLKEVALGIDGMIDRLSNAVEMSNRRARRARASESMAVGSIWDFATIERISVPVALMLASQYDRAIQLGGEAPRAINYSKWHPEVRQQLEQVGFLELCGIQHPSAPTRRYSNGTILRFTRGNTADGKVIAEYFRMMGLDLFQEDPRLSEAIAEAITNVVNHAYSKSNLCDHRCLPHWWLTGLLLEEEGKRTATIIVYDQGATIPKTIPFSKKSGNILSALKDMLGITPQPGDPKYDAEGILSAMQLGTSATGFKYRGRGLSLILETLDFCKEGRVVLYSRNGAVSVHKHADGTRRKSPVNHHGAIIGTAVIWRLEI